MSEGLLPQIQHRCLSPGVDQHLEESLLAFITYPKCKGGNCMQNWFCPPRRKNHSQKLLSGPEESAGLSGQPPPSVSVPWHYQLTMLSLIPKLQTRRGQLDVTGGDRRWIALGGSSVLSTQTHPSLCLIAYITFNLARWTSWGEFRLDQDS